MSNLHEKAAAFEETYFQVLEFENLEALRFCWKVREGLRQKVCFLRIKDYTNWYFANFIHLQLERKLRLTIAVLGKDHELAKKLLAKHRRIKRVFLDNSDIEKSLNRVEEELESLVRFEDQHVFKELKVTLYSGQYFELEYDVSKSSFICDDWPDKFWLVKR
jgi:hypothetical protein